MGFTVTISNILHPEVFGFLGKEIPRPPPVAFLIRTPHRTNNAAFIINFAPEKI